MSSLHSAGRLLAIIGAFLCYLITIVINVLSAVGGKELGIFLDNTDDILDTYHLEITPVVDWTLAVWCFVYVWQALWLIYALTTICRRKDGEYIYTLGYMPPAIYVIYILNMAINVSCVFLWDRRYIIGSFAMLALTSFTLYCALYFSFSRLYRNVHSMLKRGMAVDVWLARLFVQNGMALYAASTTIDTMLNFGIVLTYKAGVAQGTCSTILLCIIMVEVIAWFALDIVLFDKYTRYIFSPYIMQVIVFAGMVSRNFDLDRIFMNSIFMLTLLVVSAVLLVLKIFILIFRHLSRPAPTSQKYNFNSSTAMVSLTY